MPELPEVETVTRQLRSVLIGKEIQSIDVHKAKSWHGSFESLCGKKIAAIERKAKTIRIDFSEKSGTPVPDLHLLIHLKMSGQLIYVDGDIRVGGGHPTADWVRALPSSHTRVSFTFRDGTQLFFNDQRIFGWMKVMNDDMLAHEYAKLAPDITDPAITEEYLAEKCHNSRIPIKQIIMDNSIVSGVGNIYACDALNLARISPLRPASSLARHEIKNLLKSMREVINLGIQYGGATVHGEYVHVTGLAGRYQEVLRVYNRAGQPCPNCGTEIVKIKLGGRGTYYCPHCQK